MNTFYNLLKYTVLGGAVVFLAVASVNSVPAGQPEPIATIGHGGFFDSKGRQIVPTVEFVAKAQAWYRDKLFATLPAAKQAKFADFDKRLSAAVKASGQSQLVIEQRALDWLVANSPRPTDAGRMLGKVRALGSLLTRKLPSAKDGKQFVPTDVFRLDPEVERKLMLPELQPGGGAALRSSTVNSGQPYIDECALNQVPIPPRINLLDPTGLAGWKSQGFIPQTAQFIVGTPAEVRTFESPQGMCIALPRFYTSSSTSATDLDGVICLSKITSKVCFWDNQRSGVRFDIPSGTQVPIGVPDTVGGLYQAGGAELEGGSGGVCTDCHAGENPYIVHPEVHLTPSGTLMGALVGNSGALPMFAPNRYDPIVAASWPQNALSQTPPYVPAACKTCHVQTGAGRFPHLSDQLPDYCGTVLAQAIQKTMPEYAGGSLATNAVVLAFKNDWCGMDPASGPSDRGDPHLITTNGTQYDFQPAGEFTALRNSSNGFELQTRQTPITTSFVPPANAYTGLQSCVSLNTAVAFRVGKRRITYQPRDRNAASAESLQLRIDGRLTNLPPGGLNLGGGNSIANAAPDGGIDVKLADGTRVIIVPIHWASEGYWYLNVEVTNSPAREGTMGAIPAGNWLPLAPDGTSFGSAPTGMAARYALLDQTFADAWRVKPTTSLFDYAPGTSTATFTDRSWPPRPGMVCTAKIGPWGPPAPDPHPRKPVDPKTAEKLCRAYARDSAAYDACVFDVTVMGDTSGVPEGYRKSLALRAGAM